MTEYKSLIEMIGDITDTPHHILLPVSAMSTLRHGLYLRLLEKHGAPYADFRNRYGTAYPGTIQRAGLAESMQPVFDSKGAHVIIWNVRDDKSKGVTQAGERVTKLIAALHGQKVGRVAISRSLFYGQRFGGDDFDQMLIDLDLAGIGIDLYG